MGLGPHDPDLLEVEMVEEELEELEVLMADMAGGPLAVGLAADFIAAAGFQMAAVVPGQQEPEIQDFVFEDDLDVEEGGVIMQA
ncbi:hypothetical protein DCAR_0208595 [Daucus carota subsp. sativus]|uniref:Uncharacterized protein n=1 Tax=Daucus carota subsp. sativus TaxID=79200 RepID=A0A166EMU9_DAUCS|nr:hypothetical protein DCAR_0208595 [Daucus carota subsp. sativus]